MKETRFNKNWVVRFQEQLNCVSQIIKDTADIEILPFFNQPKSFQKFTKTSGEIVTNIDVNAERRLTKSLLSLLSGSEVIGEEAASENALIYNVLKNDKPVWIIDPLDGTRNFTNGKNCFAIIVALCLGGETLAGWIYDPINVKMYSAYKGVGASINGKSLNIQECLELSKMIGSTGQNFSKILNSLSHKKGKGLMDRDDKGDYWWELRSCNYLEDFNKAKKILNYKKEISLDESLTKIIDYMRIKGKKKFEYNYKFLTVFLKNNGEFWKQTPKHY